MTPASAWTATSVPEQPVVATESRGDSARSLVWEIIQTVLLTIAIFLAVRSVVQNFRVEGASMDPTLHTGQYLLINKVLYARADGTLLERLIPDRTPQDMPNFIFGGPERGDIVVFLSPGQTDKDFIKRVIALPGETIEGKNGRIFIDGRQLVEPYLAEDPVGDFPAKMIPKDHVWVMGDNRNRSSDSRVFGPINESKIVGRAILRIWPVNRLGFL